MGAAATATAAAVHLALLPGPADAQPVSRDLNIRAVVPKYCTSGGRLGPVDVELAVVVGADGRVAISAPSVTRPNVVCNAPAAMHVVSLRGGAQGSGAAAGTVMPWRATVSLGTARLTLDTAAPASAPVVTGGPVIGALAVSFELPTAAMAPGTYRDVLRIMLVPR